MIIGTAGHIDHGKTTLIRALTGVDTDRLPEEKARGISIALGYAYLPLPDGEVLGFIDVPGHERFVHTMLAGATGIDHALLVVAADDGVMPQTREHLGILSVLGVSQGTVAITKADRVDAERLAAVGDEIRTLLAATPLAGAPMFPVAAPAGTGIPELRAALAAAAAATRPDEIRSHGVFRLAVDRSFVLDGLGTVVTGTVFSGSVQVGDPLTVVPGGHEVRVRSLHAQNRAAPGAGPGERCALQLAGVARDQVPRGCWVTAPAAACVTTRCDARFQLLPEAPRVLRHWTPVHLHLGTSHVGARLALLEGDGVEPGGSTRIQLVTETPIACWHGDVFVIRDQSARYTLGGGTILDPHGWARHRGSPQRLAMLDALEQPTLAGRVAGLCELAPLGVDLGQLARSLPVPLAPLLAQLPDVLQVRAVEGALGFSAARWQALQAQVIARLARHHAELPDELGPDIARLRRMCLPQFDRVSFQALVETLVASAAVVRSGAWLHLPEHRLELPPEQQVLAIRLCALIDAGRFDPPWVRDLAATSGIPEAEVRRLLQRLARMGQLFQVVRDLFYTTASLRRLAAIAAGLQDADHAVAAAAFRDATGLGRKRAIQILEFFDRIAYTRRVRDLHVIRGDSAFAQELAGRS